MKPTIATRPIAVSLIALMLAMPAMPVVAQTDGSQGGSQSDSGPSTGDATAVPSQGAPATADNPDEAGDDVSPGDGSIEEKIEAADAPTPGVTDVQDSQTGLQGQGVGDPLQQGDGQMPESRQAQGDQQMQGSQQMSDVGSMMMDLEAFSQDVYERGFRQGYIRGIAETRARVMQEMQRQAQMRGRMMQERQSAGTPGAGTDQGPSAQTSGGMNAGNMQSGNMQSGNMQSGNMQPGNMQSGNMQPQGGDSTGMMQQGGMNGGQQQSDGGNGAQMPQAARNPDTMMAPGGPGPDQQAMQSRPGGTIVILPPGMDVETFLRQVEGMGMRSN